MEFGGPVHIIFCISFLVLAVYFMIKLINTLSDMFAMFFVFMFKDDIDADFFKKDKDA